MINPSGALAELARSYSRDIYSDHFPPPLGGGDFWPKLRNREEFEGGLEKRKGNGGKRRKKGKE